MRCRRIHFHTGDSHQRGGLHVSHRVPPLKYECQAPTLTSDRQCCLISANASSLLRVRHMRTHNNLRPCLPRHHCMRQWLLRAHGTHIIDRPRLRGVDRMRWRLCLYESVAPTVSNDRECAHTDQCVLGVSTSLLPTTTLIASASLSHCATRRRSGRRPRRLQPAIAARPLTVCASNEYEHTEPSETSDRICETFNTCASRTSTKSMRPRRRAGVRPDDLLHRWRELRDHCAYHDSDRVCAPVTTCTDQEYFDACEPTSNTLPAGRSLRQGVRVAC